MAKNGNVDQMDDEYYDWDDETEPTDDQEASAYVDSSYNEDIQMDMADMAYDWPYQNGAKMIFREGERVKIVGMSSGHGQPMGTILTVRGYNGQFATVYENNLNYYEVDLESMPYRMQDAEKAYVVAEKDYLLAKSRVEYMKETGVEELSENAFREHMIKKILTRPEMNLDEKARHIEAIYEQRRRGA